VTLRAGALRPVARRTAIVAGVLGDA